MFGFTYIEGMRLPLYSLEKNMKKDPAASIETNRLPGNLRKYFWDCDFDNLKVEEYAFFITERILNFGDLDALKWLLGQIDEEYLADVVNVSRNLNKKTKNFWLTILSQ